jgi:ABC-type transport system involved in multi-copper enzyme maturation permease subunit
MMFGKVFLTELLKLRRSKVTWMTLLAYSVGPLVAGLFMYILKDPEGARRLGLLGAKASLSMGAADWPSYLGFLSQLSAIGGMLLVSVIVAYIFGREYTENTAKNMLALPIHREWFAVAKLLIACLWFALLTVWFCVEGMAIGLLMGLPGWAPGAAVHQVLTIATTAGLLVMLSSVTAWIAQASKGFLAPLGFTMATLVMGAFLGHTGWGQWFPWTAIVLISGLTGPSVEQLPAGSYIVVAATFVLGIAVTLIHLNRADNTQ